MPDHETNITELRLQVERDDAQTERECGKLLNKIAWVLLTQADGIPQFVRCEQISSVGKVDMLVVAEAWGVGPKPYLQAYVWELKAPQLNVFRMETADRAAPTKDLYSAENQLLHYYDTVKNDSTLLKKLGILSGDDVHLGGIIIGRNKNYVKLDRQDKSYAISCAKQANEIRDKYFYGGQIKLWTWDRVIEFATIIKVGHQTFGTVSGSTNVNASQPSPIVFYNK